MQLSQLLFSQGFGSRRECAGIIALGHVSVDGQVCDDPRQDFDAGSVSVVVQGFGTQPWPYHAKALVLLHKPAGYECSQKPRHHPSVLSLLPTPLRNRGVQPVGRLDEDTTGLLLLTDDGALIHRVTSPKHHVPKVYEVTLKHPLDDSQLQRLLAGVMLDDEPAAVRAAGAQATGTHTLQLTLTEGKYHQVKRMLAAVGNRVVGLHRSRFGELSIPADLPAGGWCWVSPAQRDALMGGGNGATPTASASASGSTPAPASTTAMDGA